MRNKTEIKECNEKKVRRKTRTKPGEPKEKKKSALQTNVNTLKTEVLLQRQLKLNKHLSGTHLPANILPGPK